MASVNKVATMSRPPLSSKEFDQILRSAGGDLDRNLSKQQLASIKADIEQAIVQFSESKAFRKSAKHKPNKYTTFENAVPYYMEGPAGLKKKFRKFRRTIRTLTGSDRRLVEALVKASTPRESESAEVIKQIFAKLHTLAELAERAERGLKSGRPKDVHLQTAICDLAIIYERLDVKNRKCWKFPTSKRSHFVKFLAECLSLSGVAEFSEENLEQKWRQIRREMQPLGG